MVESTGLQYWEELCRLSSIWSYVHLLRQYFVAWTGQNFIWAFLKHHFTLEQTSQPRYLRKYLKGHRTEFHRACRKGWSLLWSRLLASLTVNVYTVTGFGLDLAFIVTWHLLGKLWKKKPRAITCCYLVQGTYIYKLVLYKHGRRASCQAIPLTWKVGHVPQI